MFKARLKFLFSTVVTTVFAVVFSFSTVNEAKAITFQNGDVFAGIGSGLIQQWREIGGVMTKVDTLDTGLGTTEQTGMAFDNAGNLYSTNFTTSNMTKFDNTGAVVSSPFVSNDAGGNNESVAFDAVGNMYIGQAGGTGDVIKRAPDGTFLARYNVAITARGSDWIDLAADQRTLFYTSEDFEIKRYDVVSDTQLPDFATLADRPAFALRLLSDGGLLVANSTDIKRLDVTGAVIQTYDAPGVETWFALNLDPDGTSFWSADIGSTHEFYKFDIATGTILHQVDTDGQGDSVFDVAGLTVFGEITQGNPRSDNNAVPEPITATLGLMGLGVLGMATRRRAA